MHDSVITFISDLAVIMIVAGIVTIIFHRLKQPVVLGYIVAGILIGPHTPPFELIKDEHTIKVLAELGVIFLMFSLGLEFSIRKLLKVGATALIAAVLEIVVMIWLGYQIGLWLGWNNNLDALFLGAILAISSTTIIVKALNDLKMKHERFAQLIFGVLIVEDILGIGLIALLSGVAISGSVSGSDVFFTISKLSLFMIVALLVGILLVPRLLGYVANFRSNEMMLVTVLGDFIIGAIIAEAKELHWIEKSIEPIRDMFSAIFFVAVGLLLDPKIMIDYAVPILIIAGAVIIGKVASCTIGAMIAGNDGRTSLKVGMGLSQIGEFSFIIAALGMSYKVTSDFLYPIAVAVSAITTLTTPYLIRAADPAARQLGKMIPQPVARIASLYGEWLNNLHPQGTNAVIWNMIKRILTQIGINMAIVIAIFLCSTYLAVNLQSHFLSDWIGDIDWRKSLIWGTTLVISLPFLIAAFRKFKALSMMLAEMSVRESITGRHTQQVRRIISETLPLLFLTVTMLLLSALSAGILPKREALILVIISIIAIVFLLRSWFVRIHSRLQIALYETLDHEDRDGHETDETHE